MNLTFTFLLFVFSTIAIVCTQKIKFYKEASNHLLKDHHCIQSFLSLRKTTFNKLYKLNHLKAPLIPLLLHPKTSAFAKKSLNLITNAQRISLKFEKTKQLLIPTCTSTQKIALFTKKHFKDNGIKPWTIRLEEITYYFPMRKKNYHSFIIFKIKAKTGLKLSSYTAITRESSY